MRKELLAEEFAVRTRTNQDELCLSALVDQQPIGRDMTFAMILVIAYQSVIAITLGQKVLSSARVSITTASLLKTLPEDFSFL